MVIFEYQGLPVMFKNERSPNLRGMDEKVLIMSHNKLCPLTGQKANAKLYNVEHHMGGKYHQLEQARAFYEPKPRHQEKVGRD
ncbi:MAG: hypothetical protein R2867_46280 [Caldilineaceae bacterium]